MVCIRFWVVSLCLVLTFNGVRIHATSTPEDLQPHRTGFHFQPPKNWINDPNGPMYFNGVYHLFYQYNAYGPLWGNISWGHSVSHDLVNWLILEPALNPDKPYDIQGCFSGSATILPGPKLIILYTGQDINGSQVQNLATPKNLSDPYLKEWVKSSSNPFLTPFNEIGVTLFRDPTTAWIGPDRKWRMVIGSEINGRGTALLYYSVDGMKWTRSKKPLHFSSETNMWECPDFYPVSNVGTNGLDASFHGNNTIHVLKASVIQELPKKQASKLHKQTGLEYYVLGTYDPKTDTFLAVSDDIKVGNAQFQYDYGRFYASKSFYDSSKQRRVLWGWVNEGDTESDAIKKGWAGLQAIPRSIWLSHTRKQLVQWPVKEIETLRTKQVNIKSRELESGTLLEVSGITASQADVEVTFNLSKLDKTGHIVSEVADPHLLCKQKNASFSGPFGILVLASKNMAEQTAVFFRVFKGPNNKFLVLMCTDLSRSSIAQEVDKSTYGTFLDLDPLHEKFSLRSLIDHSIVESFGGEGLACITARVYPKLAINEQAKLYVFNNGAESVTMSSLNAWSMNKAQIAPMARVGSLI